MAQSCSNVTHCCVPVAPAALKRSSPLRAGNASISFLQVVGDSCATPPPQMPLKSGRVCARSEAGTIAHTSPINAAVPSCGRECFIGEILLLLPDTDEADRRLGVTLQRRFRR